MKRLLKKASLIFVALLVFILTPDASAQGVAAEKRMFMVSGYYSPLPNQSFYVRGSYEADMILNGRGTNGADGTPVYIGMLAAPKSYPFGTQIRIPGLGVGEVHDRGGAILAGRAYDRIDVWMGHGEEGLARALNWGMRLVEGEMYSASHQVRQNLDFSWVSPKLPESLTNRLKAKSFINPQTFTKPIVKGSDKASIKELQEALRLFGYYHGEVNGVYDDEIKKSVLTFQLDEGVVQSVSAVGAGNFGPKTQEALKTKIENFNSRILKEQNRLRENVQSLSAGLGKKAQGDDVYSLQQMLWELGYYKGELNGSYDSITIDAVLAFQKEYGVIQNEWEKGAGYFGKKTHAALVAAADKRVERLAKYPAEMQVWVPAKIELPKLEQLNGDLDFGIKSDLSFSITFNENIKNNTFTKTLNLNDRGDDVVRLQDVLIKEGHLASGLNTGVFGYNTREALVKYQLANGIINKNTDAGAGVMGSKTMGVLNNEF